jgi:Mn-dependent DtxR family transcriptional regulator/Fe2+ or Zn2+ uptake regulation protein/Fe2+ transport system protein FeoA
MNNEQLSASLEDYLEGIYQISREEGAAHANKIADLLGVGKSSVSWALNQLSEKGLIHYTPYEAITLTPEGFEQARQIANRHVQIQRFLEEVLGLEKSVAEANACRMEHVIDPVVMEQIQQLMVVKDQNSDDENHSPESKKSKQEHSGLRSHPVGKTDGGGAAIPKVSKERDQTVLERLLNILAEAGVEPGPVEIAVMAAFMGTERHQSLAQIHQKVRHRDLNSDIGTVERVMNLLCEYKIAKAVRFRDQVLYEHYHPESHHDHMFCVKCGTIVEFYDPRLELLQTENAETAAFRVLTHNLDIYGVCQECLQRESRVRDLADCLAGEVVQVIRIIAEDTVQSRLGQMGLSPGVVVEVLSDHCPGQSVMLMAGASRLMLDGETARKVRVTLGSQEAGPLWEERRERRRHRHGAETM